jgi:hypothetical protein
MPGSKLVRDRVDTAERHCGRGLGCSAVLGLMDAMLGCGVARTARVWVLASPPADMLGEGGYGRGCEHAVRRGGHPGPHGGGGVP